MQIKLDESAEVFLTDKGYDPKFGARPLKRAIQTYIEDPLSEELLIGNIKEGDTILVSNIDGKDSLLFTTEKSEDNMTNLSDEPTSDISEKE